MMVTKIMQTIDEIFSRLEKSKFRAKIYLSLADKGIYTIRIHAEEFVRTRLASINPINDAKQTPMRGHPVFIAQHACACCCRECLEKWYKVSKETKLTVGQQERIVNLLVAWIEKELE